MNSFVLVCSALVTVFFSMSETKAGTSDRPVDMAGRADTAVRNGLRWLAAAQQTNGTESGSWETEEPRYRIAVAGLAGLAFLANGYLPGTGEYGQVVERALRHVRAGMAPDGYVGQGDRSGMYIHAMAALFGLSCLGMSPHAAEDAELAAWCRRALRVIADAQRIARPSYAQGGWRYTPYTDESDVSVTSWQLLVLHAARQCGFTVETESIDDALRFINSAFVREDGVGHGVTPRAGFVYRPGVSREPEPSASGAALFVKLLFERGRDEGATAAINFLGAQSPSWGGPPYGGYFFFSAFYMSLGMFQAGDAEWERYRAPMRELLVERQNGDGSWSSPADDTPQSRLAGPAYPTAMAVLILSLDKQYLPMYQRQQQIF